VTIGIEMHARPINRSLSFSFETHFFDEARTRSPAHCSFRETGPFTSSLSVDEQRVCVPVDLSSCHRGFPVRGDDHVRERALPVVDDDQHGDLHDNNMISRVLFFIRSMDSNLIAHDEPERKELF
jgi:hypothetical protein